MDTPAPQSPPLNRDLPAHPRPSWRIWLRRGIAVAIAAVVTVAAGVFWLWHAEYEALPEMDGTLHVAGLSAPVTVRRDAHGVPHFEAATQDDLFLAQGYVTAQDRLWQMDMFRRHANGDLAEILGATLIGHDEIQRTLRIRRTAQRLYASLPPNDRHRLDTYARGVNEFIEQSEAAGKLPAEFKFLHYRPEPWTGTDSVSVGLMEVQELDMHAATKLDRWLIEQRLRNPRLEADLYPVDSWRDHPPTGVNLDLSQPHPEPPVPNDDDLDDSHTEKDGAGPMPGAPGLNPQVAAMHVRAMHVRARGNDWDTAMAALGRPDCAGCAVGSNEWVVGGNHTASGKPLLSNDMHIQLTEPNIWYMAGLRAPGFDAAGVTLPGYPFIIAGHNEHVAWGFTDLYADVQDLYFEILDGKGNYRAADGTWKALGVDRETIRVRFGRNVKMEVKFTNHGPLVNGLMHVERPVALQWNLYDPSLRTIPLYQMNVAQNWTEFSAALANWCYPGQNLVYADDQGHIAYHAIGKVPMRPGGLRGVPIEDRAHEWHGYLPFDDLPNAYDPPSGFLGTANSRVTPDETPYPLTLEWIDPYRIDRIYKMLDGRTGLMPQDMLAVQTDIYSALDQEMAQRFAYAIDHTEGADDRLRTAADLLRAWDGRVTVDAAAPSIVDRAREALWPLLLKPKLGALWKDYHWGESTYAEEQIVMDAKAAWLPPGYKDWNALLTEAVREGMQNGKSPTDVRHWRYGDWHVVEVQHPLAKFVPLLGRFADTGPLPESGDTTTVKQVSPFIGPSQRFTMDWSNIDGSTENIVLGESSDPLSPYYRDQWDAWYNGTTFPLPFTPSAVTKQTTHMLQLEP